MRQARALGLLLFTIACSKGPSHREESGAGAQTQSNAELRTPSASGDLSVVPSYVIEKLSADERIHIDGKLDEPAWRDAKRMGPFVHAGTGQPLPSPASLGGHARLRYDERFLYVAVEAKDRNLRGGFPADAVDAHLFTRDTVELMLDPEGDGDNRDYYEIQVSPQGLVFDSQFDSYNAPRVLPDGPFGHQDWNSNLLRAVTLQGTLDNPSDRDEGYIVEMALPFAALSKLKKNPPEPGVEWRGNLYVMEDNGGVSWSPILGQGNFHRASRFGRLIFGPNR